MPSANDRIFLSAPDVGLEEREALLRAFDSGWIAPVGPELAAFEAELCEYTGAEACVALSSGTAALHLALLDAGVGPGDEVLVQSATFAASAFAVVHAGGIPTFVDSDESTWCMDPALVQDVLECRAARGDLPRAVMPVDLYGSMADYAELTRVCGHYGVRIVQDAAEALGSQSPDGMPGTLGHAAALSFNGNKIMTTSGGGALVGSTEVVDRARYLATQARQPLLHYEHTDIGFNYRMSNLLAAMGRAQLARLERGIERRAEIASAYAEHFPEFVWCPYGATDRPNHWLTVGLLPDDIEPSAVCAHLEGHNIEARPFWKPMHQQPVFAHCEVVGGAVSDRLFARGLCLPSGSSMNDEDLDRVVAAVRESLDSASAEV